MNRTLTAATAAALLALAGCASGGGTSSDSMGAPDTAYTGGKSTVMGDAAIPQAGTTTVTSVIRTGDMSLNTPDVSGTYEKVKAAVLAAGGRIETSSYYAGSDGSAPSGQVVARIPEAKLDAAIASISTLGERTSLNLSSTDVTLQRADLEARVKALTASRDRLRDLMAKARTVTELLAAEQELTSRQAELDGLTSQLDYLKGQVAESTLSIFVTTDRTGITAGLRSWGELMRQGIHGFLSSLQSAVTWVFVAVPWLAVIAGLVGAAVGLRRLVRRRR